MERVLVERTEEYKQGMDSIEELVALGEAYIGKGRAHRDGGNSQSGTRHSLPPARRRGSFNSNDQLNFSTER